MPPIFVNKTKKEKFERQLKAKKLKAAADAVRISARLSKTATEYQALCEKLVLIQLLLKEAVPGTKQMKGLEILELNTLEKLERCGPLERLKLRLQLLLCDALQKSINDIMEPLQKLH